MKGKFSALEMMPIRLALLLLCFVIGSTMTGTRAQSAPDTSALETRIARARALAAAHRLASAAAELDAIRTSATDESVRDVACMMLMNIYLEDGDYMRAGNLLAETFKSRSSQNESSVQSYYALAGQTINGARAHLERYRTFGINVADKELPNEARNDLDQLRQLLERIAEQAKTINSEDGKHTDATALIEDVSSVRAGLARDDEDRSRWQQEFESARQKLAASETRIASIGGIPGRTAGANPSPGPANSNGSMVPTSASTGNNSNNAETASSNVNSSSTPNTSTKRSGSNSKSKKAASESNRTVTTAEGSSTPSAGPAKSAANNANGESGATEGQAVDVGSLLDKATQKVNPNYPPTARNIRVSGVVTVYVLLDENGQVASVQRTNGPQLLRQAAIDAARRWKFRPTVVDGQPVRVTGYISFNFTL